MLCAELLHQRFGGRNSDDEGYRTQDIEYLALGLCVEEILKVVSCRDILNSKHDERHDTYEHQYYPWAVLEEVFEVVLEVGLLAFRWSDTLFGGGKSDEEEYHT